MWPKIADFGQPADRVIKLINTTGVIGNNAFNPDKTVLEVKDKERSESKNETQGNFETRTKAVKNSGR